MNLALRFLRSRGLRWGIAAALALALLQAGRAWERRGHELAAATARAERAEQLAATAREEADRARTTLETERVARARAEGLAAATTARQATESDIRRRAAARAGDGGRAPSDVELSAWLQDDERAAGFR